MWGVDPNLLDPGIIKKRLQRTEPRNRIKDLLPDRLHLAKWGQRTKQRPFVVVSDGCINQAAHVSRLLCRVKATAPDELTNLTFDDSYSFHALPNGQVFC
ncbi:hypothetical protein GCM10010523_07780 [Paenarthrobacter ilicis]